MKFKLFLLPVVLLAATQLKAQYYFYNGNYYESNFVYEIGASIGAMNSMTDLGGRKGVGKHGVKDFTFKNTELTAGGFFSVLYKNAIGIRLDATFGKVKGYDSVLRKVAASTNGRYERNLSFQSTITEFTAMLELHPFELFGNYSDSRYPPAVSPYVVAGVGYYKFNPQTELNGQLIDLHPLRTEGQGFAEYPHVKEYKLQQLNIPVGFGARYDLSPVVNIRTEFLYRFLFTDYLDDVSGKYIEPSYFTRYLKGTDLTNAILLNDRHIPGAAYSTAHPDGVRGNPNRNDAYLSFTVKLGITLGRERR